MENYKETYHKAQVLMQSALDKYGKGDFEGGSKDRELANKYFDLAEKTLNSEMYKTSMLYGEGRNFGIIFKVIEENANKLYKTNDGRKKLKKIVKTIMENKCLKKQFDVYNALSTCTPHNNNKKYVSEAIAIGGNMNAKEIKKNNDKLIKLIRTSKLNEMIDIPENELNLFESIEYVITNKRNFKNLEEYIVNENVITKYLENTVNEEKVKDIDTVLDEMKEKYDNILNEDEMDFINELSSIKENKEEKFNEHKEKLVKLINEEMKKAEKEDLNEWNAIYEKISGKTYDEKTFINDVAEMIEIENTIIE